VKQCLTNNKCFSMVVSDQHEDNHQAATWTVDALALAELLAEKAIEHPERSSHAPVQSPAAPSYPPLVLLSPFLLPLLVPQCVLSTSLPRSCSSSLLPHLHLDWLTSTAALAPAPPPAPTTFTPKTEATATESWAAEEEENEDSEDGEGGGMVIDDE